LGCGRRLGCDHTAYGAAKRKPQPQCAKSAMQSVNSRLSCSAGQVRAPNKCILLYNPLYIQGHASSQSEHASRYSDRQGSRFCGDPGFDRGTITR
jgi:hypothetical protein